MKKQLALALLMLGTSAFAADITFDNLSKSDVENVSKEFAANFGHTTVSAPETEGIWGIEVGLAGGKTKSPDLADVIEDSGGEGDDFETLFHAGLIARAHFPLDLFAELSLLPEREISDVEIKNTSIGGGWNAGAFFGWPLDVAAGFGFSSSRIAFVQDSPVPNTKVELESKTKIFYVGVSKKFLFVTPYLKVGKASADSDVSATGSIFTYTGAEKESVTSDGSYIAVGANLQFLIMRLGFEYAKVMGVGSMSGKLSVAF